MRKASAPDTNGKVVDRSSSPAPERERALEMALSQVERAFGKGAVMRLGAADREQIEAIPTGSLSLDLALGVGGLQSLAQVSLGGGVEAVHYSPLRCSRSRA